MKTLSRLIGRMFKPRRVDPYRKARERAKELAAHPVPDYVIEIERLKDGGFNVWPPKAWPGDDPLAGDHFCHDWDEVLLAVRTYSGEV